MEASSCGFTEELALRQGNDDVPRKLDAVILFFYLGQIGRWKDCERVPFA